MAQQGLVLQQDAGLIPCGLEDPELSQQLGLLGPVWWPEGVGEKRHIFRPKGFLAFLIVSFDRRAA